MKTRSILNFFVTCVVWIVINICCVVCVSTVWADTATGSVGGKYSDQTKDADRKIKEAYQKFQSDFWVKSQGVVIKVLKDDNDGARHQRFLLKLSNGHSVLVAHNIDVAPRINNLKSGDIVGFYGEYEWNNKGGVIHWTHRDLTSRKSGGWLLHEGRKYE